MVRKFIFITGILLILSSCLKDEGEMVVQESLVKITMSHAVDGEILVFNTREYENAAGNYYKVSHLEYYISQVEFLNENFEWVGIPGEPELINPEIDSERAFFVRLPQGRYFGIRCMIGLPIEKNIDGYLYPSLENVNMVWPTSMGGGYHFMKFEGYYYDSDNVLQGFVVHLGQNGNQVVNEILDISFDLTSQMKEIGLKMNMNEWFTTPHLFNLNKDGNYTMGVDTLMVKISENGRDCLSARLK